MADNQESAISDPRASLRNYSNRQESGFQYGDPPKNDPNVNNHEQTNAKSILRMFCFFRKHQN